MTVAHYRYFSPFQTFLSLKFAMAVKYISVHCADGFFRVFVTVVFTFANSFDVFDEF